MVLFLLLLSGMCWAIVYIELICLGFKEKTYGMPFIALAFNFTWRYSWKQANSRSWNLLLCI